MSRVGSEQPLGFGHLREELKVLDHVRDHRAELRTLILTQKVFQVHEVIVAAGFDACPEAFKVQAGASAIPELEHSQRADQFLLQRARAISDRS